jgi:hypothetical protein
MGEGLERLGKGWDEGGREGLLPSVGWDENVGRGSGAKKDAGEWSLVGIIESVGKEVSPKERDVSSTSASSSSESSSSSCEEGERGAERSSRDVSMNRRFVVLAPPPTDRIGVVSRVLFPFDRGDGSRSAPVRGRWKVGDAARSGEVPAGSLAREEMRRAARGLAGSGVREKVTAGVLAGREADSEGTSSTTVRDSCKRSVRAFACMNKLAIPT